MKISTGQLKQLIREAMTHSELPTELEQFIDSFVADVAEYWMHMLDNDDEYFDDVAAIESKLTAELKKSLGIATSKIEALR